MAVVKHGGILMTPYVQAVANVPAGAVAADYEGCFFIADRAYEIVSVKERHLVAGSDGGAVTVMLKKVPSGTAPSAGVDTLSGGINLKAAANTNQNGALHGTPGNYQLAAGDALALVTTGTLTAVDGVSVHVQLKPI